MIPAATFIGGGGPDDPHGPPPRDPPDLPRPEHVPGLSRRDLVPPGVAADHLHGRAGHRRVRADAVHAAHPPGADQAGLGAEHRLGRHRRRRRGQGGAARGRRLPQRPPALPRARRQGAQGHPPARPARHRQDAAGQGRGPRVRRHLLLPVGRLVRRDVRRRRRRPHPPPVQGRAQEGAGDRVHRRARRGRRPPRLRRLRRARPDPEPAPGRDGRLHRPQGGGGDRRLEPAREARPGPAAPRPLRPPDLRLARPTSPGASASSTSTRATSRWPTTST